MHNSLDKTYVVIMLTIFRLHTVSSVSTEKLYFPTCFLIIQRKENIYEVTTTIVNCLLLATTVTLVCVWRQAHCVFSKSPFSACVP